MSKNRVLLPPFPGSKDSIDKTNISIGQGHGKIKRFKLVLAKEVVKESLRGIAIQRGGMTVTRYGLPANTQDDLRERVYGYCQLDEELDREMWAIELANHEGFESRKAVWVKLRRQLDGLCEDFLAKYSKKKASDPPPLNVDEIVGTINKLVSEHLEGMGRKGGGGGGGGGGGVELPPIRISPWGYLGDDRRFNANEIMELNGAIENVTNRNASIELYVWIQDRAGSKYWETVQKRMTIEPNLRHRLDLPDVEFHDLGMKRGVYKVCAAIRNRKGHTLHQRAAQFYYLMDPPPMGGWLKGIVLSHLGGPHENLRNLPINKKGVLLINLAYPETEAIWNNGSISKTQKAKQLTPVFINIAIHEAIREVSLNWWQDETVDYDIGQIKRAKDLFDEVWASYLRGAIVNG